MRNRLFESAGLQVFIGIMVGLFVGGRIYCQPHPGHECLNDDHCKNVHTTNDPQCNGTLPDCKSDDLGQFWKCFPKDEKNCTENRAQFGFTTCNGLCSAYIVNLGWVQDVMRSCSFELNHCK